MKQVLFPLKTVSDLVAKYLQKNNTDKEQFKDKQPDLGYLKRLRKYNRFSFKNAKLSYM